MKYSYDDIPLDFNVAYSIFAESGIVLRIAGNGNQCFFDANNWSCFPNEDERLFLSPRSPLIITNIHDIVNGKQFKTFVKVINILSVVCMGWPAQFPFQRASDPVASEPHDPPEMNEFGFSK